MSQVIQLFPHRTAAGGANRELPEIAHTESPPGARRQAAAAIRSYLEKLLTDADVLNLRLTKAALVVAIAAATNEVD